MCLINELYYMTLKMQDLVNIKIYLYIFGKQKGLDTMCSNEHLALL